MLNASAPIQSASEALDKLNVIDFCLGKLDSADHNSKTDVQTAASELVSAAADIKAYLQQLKEKQPGNKLLELQQEEKELLAELAEKQTLVDRTAEKLEQWVARAKRLQEETHQQCLLKEPAAPAPSLPAPPPAPEEATSDPL